MGIYGDYKPSYNWGYHLVYDDGIGWFFLCIEKYIDGRFNSSKGMDFFGYNFEIGDGWSRLESTVR